MSEINNKLERVRQRYQQISNMKDRAVEIIDTEQNKEKRIFKIVSLRDLHSKADLQFH